MTARNLDHWHVSRVLAGQAAARRDVAFVEMTDGGRATFGEMDEAATRIAGALAGADVRRGDKILLMARNSIEFAQIWFGVSRLGAVLVPVNTGLKGTFFEHVCANSGARLIIVEDEFLAVIEASWHHLPLLERIYVIPARSGSPVAASPGGGILPFEALFAGPAGEIPAEGTCRDIAAIIYTSGTTGPSKGALLPHGHLHLNAKIFIDALEITEEDVIYCCLPLFHLNALTLQLYCALIVGCRIVMARSFSASGWLPDIRRAGATVTNLLGAMTEFVYAQPAAPDDPHNPLRIACVVPIPVAYGQDLERRFGMKAVELYGTTETNCPLYMPTHEPTRPGACGKLVGEWFEARIVGSETDRELEPGLVGEFVVRPREPWCFMAGYHQMPNETLRAWRNFWFHTGDAMRRDDSGYFYFVDRMKDCIRRKGENISSYEVEQVVLSHPSVGEAAVVGVSSASASGEQEVKACVVLRPGSAVSPDALMQFCRDRMPDFAVPRLIEFMGELPKTATAKVSKALLRERGVTAETWIDPALTARRRVRA